MYQRLSLIVLVFLAISTTPALSQELRSDLLGISIVGDYVPESGVLPSLGFVFERKFAAKSGFELGLFYKTNKTKSYWDLILPDGSYHFGHTSVRESLLSIPVVYRYYSKAATVSLGPVFEAFVGWNQVSQKDITVEKYKRSPSFDFGPILKVSRPIALRGNVIVEPEVRFGIMARSETAYFGLGIQLKQHLLSKD